MSTIQRLFRWLANGDLMSHSSTAASTKGISRRRMPFRHQQQLQNNALAQLLQGNRRSGPLEVAKFALLSIATLPFTLWVAQFTYDYYYRVEFCLEALNQEDHDLRIRHRRNEQNVVHRGREAQLNQVKTLLAKDPHQVVLVAGVNECGKSKFVSEVLRSVNSGTKKPRGVTHIQLAQLVDSVSSFTFILVNSFNLKWLSLRYSLVDVLPFAGSEILVMKERFSDRDLAQALHVVTEALKKHAQGKSKKQLPIIVIDGLAEGKSWARTQEGKQCLERLFQWFIYVTKERKLAHIVLTGNEELVLSLTDQNRLTRGHVKVIGLGDIQKDEARHLVLQEMPDASEEEIQSILDAFGGFIHDVRGVARDIQDQLDLAGSLDSKLRARIVEDSIATRCRMQFERVTAAFAKGRDELEDASSNDGEEADEEEMDPYLDPLKAVYSEAQASQNSAALSDDEDDVSYTKLQLWQTLQMLVDARDGSVAFAELRDDVFSGDQAPLLELMNDDVLGFEIEDSQSSGFSWKVKPATPALYGAFQQIVSDSSLKERFQQVEQNSNRQDEIREIARHRMNIKKERKELEERKAAIQSTVELGEKLDRKAVASTKLTAVFDALVKEEHDALVRDYELREKMKSLEKSQKEESPQTVSKTKTENEVQQHLKNALLAIMMQKESSSSEDDGGSPLFAAFQELDSSQDGTFEAEDVVRVIKAYTGKDVRLRDAQRLVLDWDSDHDKHIDFDEFSSWYSAQEKKKTKSKR